MSILDLISQVHSLTLPASKNGNQSDEKMVAPQFRQVSLRVFTLLQVTLCTGLAEYLNHVIVFFDFSAGQGGGWPGVESYVIS